MKKTSLFIRAAALAFVVAAVFAQANIFFGKASPGPEPVKFLHETLHQGLCPHGQLAFSPDGSGVFWSAIALEGRRQTIYWSAFDGKAFSPPVVAPFAAEAGNGGPSFSSDGRRLFFNVEIPGPDAASPKTMAIAYVERSGSGWTKPVQIESTIDTLMTKGQVSVARSGNIYFTGRILTERAPAIFVSRFVGNKYFPPEKLAGPIAEVPLLVDPWIDPDERFLLVSSPPAEGPPMLTDIGICSRQSDGAWSKPVRLSGPVNTTAFERFTSLSSDGKYLFFIRAFGQQFVSDQAHFFWVETKDIPEFQSVLSQEKALPVLRNQEPPEASAEVFAPGVISLPGRIEFCLALSPDGNEAFFAVRKNPGQWEIHRTERRDGAWQPSVTAPFSGVHSDLEPTFSPDGQRLSFSSNRPLEDQASADGFNLWLVERQDGGWSLPRPLPAPINGPGDQWRASQGRSGNLYYSSGGLWTCPFADGKAGQPVKLFDPQSPQGLIGGHAFVSPEETYLLTAWMDGPGHRGGWDIYISFRDGQGNWSPSINLGDTVNTPAGEDFPLVSPDGRDLYFFRHQKSESGEESGDIFRIDAGFIQTLKEKALAISKEAK